MAIKRTLRSLTGMEKVGSGGTGGNSTEYTVVIQCYDDANDREALSPNKLLTHLAIPAAPFLPINNDYSGFDSDDPDITAFIKTIEIGDLECDDELVPFRDVTIKYDTERAAGNEPPTGEDKQDPLEWEPRITIREVSRSMGASSLIFLGAFVDLDTNSCKACLTEIADGSLSNVSNASVVLTKGECTAIKNSAGTLFERPPEIDRIDDEITLTKFSASVLEADDAACYKNTINHEDLLFDLSTTQLFKQNFKKHTLKLTSVTKELKQRRWRTSAGEQTRLYWEKKYIMLYRPSGWYFDIANAGKMRNAGPSQPDGFGGTIPATPLPAGVPPQKPIERDGHTGEEFNLDLNGQPIPAFADVQYYLRWRLPTSNFQDAALGLFPLILPP
jgi:hypothetical protein